MNGTTGPQLEEVDVDTLYLQPPAFKKKEKGKWQESGQTIAFGLNPVDGAVASWITHRVSRALELHHRYLLNVSRYRKLVKLPRQRRKPLQWLLLINLSRSHRSAISPNH
jgi:hypothetical protein